MRLSPHATNEMRLYKITTTDVEGVASSTDGHPVELQLLYPDLGVEEPIAAVAGRYELDRGALEAAARSALAVSDRVVVLDVLAPAA